MLAKMRQQHAAELEAERTAAGKQTKILTDEFHQQTRLMYVMEAVGVDCWASTLSGAPHCMASVQEEQDKAEKKLALALTEAREAAAKALAAQAEVRVCILE